MKPGAFSKKPITLTPQWQPDKLPERPLMVLPPAKPTIEPEPTVGTLYDAYETVNRVESPKADAANVKLVFHAGGHCMDFFKSKEAPDSIFLSFPTASEISDKTTMFERRGIAALFRSTARDGHQRIGGYYGDRKNCFLYLSVIHGGNATLGLSTYSAKSDATNPRQQTIFNNHLIGADDLRRIIAFLDV
jgi:hypothetical protein